ncbi:MAG: sugar phosphate isomerase/epimerase [Eubacteriaceae bacterium]|nr:sugar phosphate isomerase/epimerase [Eubacteriaceae bacterium]
MPTLIGLGSLEECAALCCELGLDFVELNMCLPMYQLGPLSKKLLLDIAKRFGLFYTIHLDDTNTPCDFNNKVANAFTESVLDTIEIAKQTPTPIINMHLSTGAHFTLPDRKVLLFEEYKQHYLDKLAIFKDLCESAIGNSGIVICVENTDAFEYNFGSESLDLLFESPVFKLTFDIGHDASSGFKQRPVIDRHITKLGHMHIHDANPGKRQDHMPLGTGVLDLAVYVELAISYSCTTVIEVKTVQGLRNSVPVFFDMARKQLERQPKLP